jgi:hypothetical protein
MMPRPLAGALLSALLALTTACAKVDYIGRVYPPTMQVDLFFAEQDVPRPYDVMGRVVATGNDAVSLEKIQEKIMDKAREKGADAIVIIGLDRYPVGQETQVRETVSAPRRGRR